MAAANVRAREHNFGPHRLAVQMLWTAPRRDCIVGNLTVGNAPEKVALGIPLIIDNSSIIRRYDIIADVERVLTTSTMR